MDGFEGCVDIGGKRGNNDTAVVSIGLFFCLYIDIRRQRLGFVAKKDYVFNQSRDWLFLRGCADNSENGE